MSTSIHQKPAFANTSTLRVPPEILCDPSIPAVVRVKNFYYAYCQMNEWCWISTENIGPATALTPLQVKKARYTLLTQGFLESQPHTCYDGHWTHKYRLAPAAPLSTQYMDHLQSLFGALKLEGTTPKSDKPVATPAVVQPVAAPKAAPAPKPVKEVASAPVSEYWERCQAKAASLLTSANIPASDCSVSLLSSISNKATPDADEAAVLVYVLADFIATASRNPEIRSPVALARSKVLELLAQARNELHLANNPAPVAPVAEPKLTRDNIVALYGKEDLDVLLAGHGHAQNAVRVLENLGSDKIIQSLPIPDALARIKAAVADCIAKKTPRDEYTWVHQSESSQVRQRVAPTLLPLIFPRRTRRYR
jgi:hypothetical protein